MKFSKFPLTRDSIQVVHIFIDRVSPCDRRYSQSSYLNRLLIVVGECSAKERNKSLKDIN